MVAGIDQVNEGPTDHYKLVLGADQQLPASATEGPTQRLVALQP